MTDSCKFPAEEIIRVQNINLIAPTFFSKNGVFSFKYYIFGRKFSDKKFQTAQNLDGGALLRWLLPLPPSFFHNANGEWSEKDKDSSEKNLAPNN